MRISDWSSDVCSSDLALRSPHASSPPLSRQYPTVGRSGAPVCLIPRRQTQREARALARRACEGDVATHRAGEAAGNIEAEPVAARLGRVNARDFLEHTRLVFGHAPPAPPNPRYLSTRRL